MPVIRRLNSLDRPEKEGLYRILIPPSLFRRFCVDPVSLCNEKGEKAVRFFCPAGDRTCLVEMKLPDLVDPVYSIQLTDSQDPTQVQMDFIVANDPASPEYRTHVDEQGRDTLFGWASRNIDEEVKAMRGGLFPGQVRRGLSVTREVVRLLEFFCTMMDLKAVRLEALFYHNAVTYERHGFGYFSGYRLMKRIHEGFQPGGKIHQKLDRSTPFREPELGRTVRGRSWAIHDGILTGLEDAVLRQGWVSPSMYRMIEHPRAMITFPHPVY